VAIAGTLVSNVYYFSAASLTGNVNRVSQCAGAGTTLSDGTLVARLGNANGERQATGAAASASGRLPAAQDGQWLGSGVPRSGSLGKQESQIELPALPWSDWEIPEEQITICKREDGSDWELGAGAFGKVQFSPYFCNRELLLGNLVNRRS
jgi:hypothetical protein